MSRIVKSRREMSSSSPRKLSSVIESSRSRPMRAPSMSYVSAPKRPSSSSRSNSPSRSWRRVK
ncbi:MAG: hypothetical protein AUG91_01335 [Actinobacteria bacterium 13_1_20CM_4_69_9]|nr:MAG: hypothetical protein AUG91_01335 [Actinobacteria bacterium 13_1_20CM_4_69_9]